MQKDPRPGDCIAVDERCTVANARLLGRIHPYQSIPKWNCCFCFDFLTCCFGKLWLVLLLLFWAFRRRWSGERERG